MKLAIATLGAGMFIATSVAAMSPSHIHVTPRDAALGATGVATRGFNETVSQNQFGLTGEDKVYVGDRVNTATFDPYERLLGSEGAALR